MRLSFGKLSPNEQKPPCQFFGGAQRNDGIALALTLKIGYNPTITLFLHNEFAMKTKLLLLAVACLLLFAETGYSQLMMSSVSNTPQGEMRINRIPQRAMEIGMRNVFRSHWDGRMSASATLGLLYNPDVRAACGISDEQFEHMQHVHQNLWQTAMENPEFQTVMQEMGALQAAHQEAIGNGTFLQSLDEETLDRYYELSTQQSELMVQFLSDTLDNALTPEQQIKIGEIQLAMMGNTPLVSPNVFEALNLTDAQRQEMERIKKELEPEFERILGDFTRNQIILQNKYYDELERQGGLIFANSGEMLERSRSASNRLLEDPEFRRINEESAFQGREFSTQFRIRMFDVLDDEQWTRLQDLIDNPPWLIGVRARMQREQAERNERNVWQPGPGSWQPGDPIPEEYRQQRNLDRRFPRPAN